MARKLRSLSFGDLSTLPALCPACVFWESAGERERRCGAVCDAEQQGDWYRRVTDEWGECGRVAVEDDQVLGFIKYAPSGYFPQAMTFPAAPRDPHVPLIACLHVSVNARHHGLGSLLLKAALRDLTVRGERKVEVFANTQQPLDLEESPMMGIDFLLRNGFVVSQADPRYPLLRLDLRSLAMVAENLETVLNSLRIPMRVPERTPAPWIQGR